MTDTTKLSPAGQWLTEPELGQRLGYSKTTVWRLRKRGLPHTGSYRLRRYNLTVVLDWLSKNA